MKRPVLRPRHAAAALSALLGCATPHRLQNAPPDEPLLTAHPVALPEGAFVTFDWPLPAALMPVKGPPCADASVEFEAPGGAAASTRRLEGKALAAALGSVVVLPGSGELLPKARPGQPVLFGFEPLPLPGGLKLTARCGAKVVGTARVAPGGREAVEALPVLALPFASGRWVAGNGPSAASGHRRALIAFEDAPAAAPRAMERYGIDWFREEDRAAQDRGEPDNARFASESVEVRAVAAGTVLAVTDGLPENSGGPRSRAVEITEATIGGNSVALALDDGLHVAFFAHLQPGSLRVKAGEHVEAGAVLGRLGNSGNSTSPHLHFHLARRAPDGTFAPLRNDSVAYRLRGAGWVAPQGCTPLEGAMPGEEQVVVAGGCPSAAP